MKATQEVEGTASTQQPSQKQLMRAGQGQQQQQPTPGTKAASGEHEHPGQPWCGTSARRGHWHSSLHGRAQDGSFFILGAAEEGPSTGAETVSTH